MTVAVVTGASRGIGREVCRQLVELDYTVVAGARDPDKVDVAGAHPVQLDVTSVESVAAAAEHVRDKFGGASILVNNAGIPDVSEMALDLDLGLDLVKSLMEVNLYGSWRCSIAFAPQLRDADHARLVNVTSTYAQISQPHAGQGPYTVSKSALNMLTAILAKELQDDGVLVNAVCPGWTSTDMGDIGGPGGRPVEEGAASVVWAVTIADDGPTGGFFLDGEPVDW